MAGGYADQGWADSGWADEGWADQPGEIHVLFANSIVSGVPTVGSPSKARKKRVIRVETHTLRCAGGYRQYKDCMKKRRRN
jgi:hypothetical protein